MRNAKIATIYNLKRNTLQDIMSEYKFPCRCLKLVISQCDRIFLKGWNEYVVDVSNGRMWLEEFDGRLRDYLLSKRIPSSLRRMLKTNVNLLTDSCVYDNLLYNSIIKPGSSKWKIMYCINPICVCVLNRKFCKVQVCAAIHSKCIHRCFMLR